MMKFKSELVICQRTQNCTIMPTRLSLFNYNANLFLNTQHTVYVMIKNTYASISYTECVEYIYTLIVALL